MPRIYIEMMNGRPIMAYWTIEDAVRVAGMTREQAKSCLIPVELQPLSLDVRRYYEYRGYQMPDIRQAFLFLTSEVGELADELVQAEGGWVRNHPESKGKGIQGEAADVLMMLLVLSMQPDTWFDPIEAMFAKWASKGFPLITSRQEPDQQEA
jgi:hypothetical protein